MRFIDLHCDTIMNFYLQGFKLAENPGHIDMSKLEQGEALAQCFAIFVPTNDIAREEKVTATPYEYFTKAFDVYQQELAANAARIAPAFTAEDIRKNQKDGKISAILTLEDSAHIDGKMERVDELREKNVRIASLTWNYENSIAYPNSRDKAIMEKGLKPFGIDAVRHMCELGIIIDVSHLSDGGFYDLLKYTDKPFVATHSCARALCDHTRNLTDDMLKKLGERGGIVGVNFCSSFLRENSNYTSIEDVVTHLKYMGDKAGIDALALGSDFDGIGSQLEFKDYSGMPRIADALSKHFTASQVDKICFGNALRVLEG